MITSNVLQRVFHIKFRNSSATAFTIDIDGKQYFVTAKHVLLNLKTMDFIEIFHDNLWKKLNVVLIGHSEKADVTVFAIDLYIPAYPLTATATGIVLSQEVFFLGFPLGLMSDVGEINRNFPLPLVKKGCLSSMPFSKENSEGPYMFIDGHNNRGFSGGPVVFQKSAGQEFSVCGIIHGYMNDIGDVVSLPTENTEKLISLQNSGIMKAYSIQNALDLIQANPIGFLIPSI
jgi:S1-C subfamily serine protease